MRPNQTEVYPVIIIGGGPCGLAASYYLKKYNVKHIIIEKKEMLQTWKNERWDSFHLISPNWMTNIPGIKNNIPYNNEYMSGKEIYKLLKEFMDVVDPNYMDNTNVNKLYKEEGLYKLETDQGIFHAQKVIVAVGLFNQPFIPPVAVELAKDIQQIHSSEYKNPNQLKKGATLIVGGGCSGVQIALEIKEYSKDDVYLSLGSIRPIPVIYRNVNGMYWLNRLSGFSSGKPILPYRDKDLCNENIKNVISQNLFSCLASGVKLTGRLIKGQGTELKFSNSLCNALERSNTYMRSIEKRIDIEIDRMALNLPNLQVDFNLKTINCDNIHVIRKLDMMEHDIQNIVWCTGYKPDYSWIMLDIFDALGEPELIDGYTTKEDVYFCGLRLLSENKKKSTFGVGLYAFAESARRAVEALMANE